MRRDAIAQSRLPDALRVVAADDSPTGKQQIFNTLLAFDTDARLLSTYDKQHLVPFGEYLPFQSLLESIGLQQLTRQRGGFAAGTGKRVLSVPGLPMVTPLICYEVIFSGRVISEPNRPEWLLVVTNDAWFGAWAGPRQHFHQARVRAVELGLPLIRVSNNGISAAIGPVGMVNASLDLERRGTLDVTLPQALGPTVFAKFGRTVFAIGLILCLFITIAIKRRGRVVSQTAQP